MGVVVPGVVKLKKISGLPKVSKVVESMVSHNAPEGSNSGWVLI